MKKIGLIGISEGNGHPYSWGSIYNGYSKASMIDCPFKVIPDYLSKEKWPDAQLENARITHIWTQSLDESINISRSCLINNIEKSINDMIGKVDGILMARDDYENNFYHSCNIISNGVPIYIDKPIAVKVRELEKIYTLATDKWKIFSCSALRYAPELKKLKKDINDVEKIKSINAKVPKNWDKYAIHAIEPIEELLGELITDEKRRVITNKRGTKQYTSFHLAKELEINIECMGKNKCDYIELEVITGEKRFQVAFENTFAAFRNTHIKFLEGIEFEKEITPYSQLESIVKMIEEGISNE